MELTVLDYIEHNKKDNRDYYHDHKIWYAVCRDDEDYDHGTGAESFDEAFDMAKEDYDDGYEDARIDVVSEDDDFFYGAYYVKDLI